MIAWLSTLEFKRFTWADIAIGLDVWRMQVAFDFWIDVWLDTLFDQMLQVFFCEIEFEVTLEQSLSTQLITAR